MTRGSAETQTPGTEPSGTQEWISGRFRGVYASERAGNSEGARRLPIELQYGALSDAEPSDGPPAEEAPDELRFAKLRRVKIVSAEGGAAETERTLFDVRIRAWKLLYPAESARRIYGTLVGELTGRLSPLPIEPEPLPPLRAPAPSSAPAPAVTPAPEAKSPDPVSAPVLVPEPLAPLPDRPRPPTARPDDSTPEQDLERLLWLIVPALLGVVGLALALLCSPETAAIWLGPLAAAIAVRQTPTRYRIDDTLHWFGGLCVLVQIFVLLGPLQTEWVAGCRPPLRALLPLLAVPVGAAALVRTQIFTWVCGGLWTLALCGWCGSLDGSCTAAALAAPARGAASVPSAPLPPPRTDPDGRWPAQPGAPRSTPASEEPRGPQPYVEQFPPMPDPAASGGAAPGHPRISLDQAGGDPDAFFAPNGPHIYIPGDDLFEARKAELRRGREANLEQLARLLALHPERRVVIEVHTDGSGDAAASLALARQRAQALSEYFARRGAIASGQLRFEPVGAARPLVPSDGSSSEQRANRRLEIRLAE